MTTNVLKITGEVTVDRPEQFAHWMEKLPLGNDVTVDLQDVEKIDSSCVSLMLNIVRRIRLNGGQTRFINVPDQLLRLVNLYGTDQLLNCAAAD